MPLKISHFFTIFYKQDFKFVTYHLVLLIYLHRCTMLLYSNYGQVKGSVYHALNQSEK